MGIQSEEFINLVKTARASAENAYAPYSKFRVGAAVQMDGAEDVFSGCNVENASYGGTICAERVAISSAVAAGFQKIDVIAISLPDVQPGADLADRSPCGICRQFIHEFSHTSGDTLVLIDQGTKTFDFDVLTIAELLPFGFRL